MIPTQTTAQPDAHIGKLNIHALMGTWTCTGADDQRSALSATMSWGFNDGGGFYLTLKPKPVTASHTAIAEVWEWDDAGSVWRAIPDAGSAEQAQFTSGGWVGNTLTWVRMAAESTQDRVFIRIGPDRLTLRSERGIESAGAGHPTRHVIFHLACRRIVNDAPR